MNGLQIVRFPIPHLVSDGVSEECESDLSFHVKNSIKKVWVRYSN